MNRPVSSISRPSLRHMSVVDAVESVASAHAALVGHISAWERHVQAALRDVHSAAKKVTHASRADGANGASNDDEGLQELREAEVALVTALARTRRGVTLLLRGERTALAELLTHPRVAAAPSADAVAAVFDSAARKLSPRSDPSFKVDEQELQHSPAAVGGMDFSPASVVSPDDASSVSASSTPAVTPHQRPRQSPPPSAASSDGAENYGPEWELRVLRKARRHLRAQLAKIEAHGSAADVHEAETLRSDIAKLNAEIDAHTTGKREVERPPAMCSRAETPDASAAERATDGGGATQAEQDGGAQDVSHSFEQLMAKIIEGPSVPPPPSPSDDDEPDEVGSLAPFDAVQARVQAALRAAAAVAESAAIESPSTEEYSPKTLVVSDAPAPTAAESDSSGRHPTDVAKRALSQPARAPAPAPAPAPALVPARARHFAPGRARPASSGAPNPVPLLSGVSMTEQSRPSRLPPPLPAVVENDDANEDESARLQLPHAEAESKRSDQRTDSRPVPVESAAQSWNAPSVLSGQTEFVQILSAFADNAVASRRSDTVDPSGSSGSDGAAAAVSAPRSDGVGVLDLPTPGSGIATSVSDAPDESDSTDAPKATAASHDAPRTPPRVSSKRSKERQARSPGSDKLAGRSPAQRRSPARSLRNMSARTGAAAVEAVKAEALKTQRAGNSPLRSIWPEQPAATTSPARIATRTGPRAVSSASRATHRTFRRRTGRSDDSLSLTPTRKSQGRARSASPPRSARSGVRSRRPIRRAVKHPEVPATAPIAGSDNPPAVPPNTSENGASDQDVSAVSQGGSDAVGAMLASTVAAIGDGSVGSSREESVVQEPSTPKSTSAASRAEPGSGSPPKPDAVAASPFSPGPMSPMAASGNDDSLVFLDDGPSFSFTPSKQAAGDGLVELEQAVSVEPDPRGTGAGVMDELVRPAVDRTGLPALRRGGPRHPATTGTPSPAGKRRSRRRRGKDDSGDSSLSRRLFSPTPERKKPISRVGSSDDTGEVAPRSRKAAEAAKQASVIAGTTVVSPRRGTRAAPSASSPPARRTRPPRYSRSPLPGPPSIGIAASPHRTAARVSLRASPARGETGRGRQEQGTEDAASTPVRARSFMPRGGVAVCTSPDVVVRVRKRAASPPRREDVEAAEPAAAKQPGNHRDLRASWQMRITRPEDASASNTT